MTDHGASAGRWKWVVLALAAVIVVVVVDVLSWGGSCNDYAPPHEEASTCFSGPAVGPAGAWIIGILGAGVTVFAVYKAFRPSPRR